MFDELAYEVGILYIMDKGYIGFIRLYILHCNKAYFVTKAKDNMQFRRIYSNELDRITGIIFDQIGKLVPYNYLKSFPEKHPRVEFHNAETDKVFISLITMLS